MIGKKIYLENKKAIILNDTCDLPNYKLHWEGDDYLENNFRVDGSTLKIVGDSVQILSLSCNSKPHFLNSKFPRDFSYDFILTSKTILAEKSEGKSRLVGPDD